MAQLSSEERIARVEQAPVEVQTMVAKAFLRDDIDDEDVQYLFNTDTIEQLNDSECNQEVEHVNEEEPEGIGAAGFTMRTSKPSNNKNFITTGSGGWNTCIKGYPMDPNANVLANCVGYASGRFNEIINIARDTGGCTYTTLNCNAVGFKERAEAAGLQTGSTPRRGAIGCCGGGSGAGHVFIVERVDSNNRIYTSESGYGSTAFWNQIRDNSNGRWGMSSSYYFKCFIYLPDDVQKLIDGGQPTPPTPGPSGKYNIGDKVVVNGPLYVNSNAASPAGSVSNKITNITRKNPGSAHPYNTTGDLGWMDESSISPYNEPTPPAPQPTGLQVGDTVVIVGTGNGSSYGDSNTAYGIGWTRQILRIWDGRPFPYQVGNNSGTTGFYRAEALQKK
jgi:surface antigen